MELPEESEKLLTLTLKKERNKRARAPRALQIVVDPLKLFENSVPLQTTLIDAVLIAESLERRGRTQVWA